MAAGYEVCLIQYCICIVRLGRYKMLRLCEFCVVHM